MKRKASTAIIGLLGGALFLAGCSKEREVASGTVVDEATGEKAEYSVRQDGDGGTVTVNSGDSQAVIQTGANAKAALPDGFQLYPGATVQASVASTGDASQQGHVLTFQSNDPADKIVTFYRSAAAGAGYAIENEGVMNGTSMVGGRKPDGASFQLMVVPGGGGSTVTFVHGKDS